MILTPRLRLVFWETTAGCNLACIHCRRLETSTQMMKDDLSFAESLAFVDQLATLGPLILVLSGGEPLIRNDLMDIAHYAVWRGLTVALATNGTMIDTGVASQIKESGIRRVAVSIDGADPTTHDEFRRQPGSLAAALRGMTRCREVGLSLQINCTITRHNIHQLNALYDLALRYSADALHLFMLVPVGCGLSIADTHRLSGDQYEEALNWIYDRAFEGKIFVKATCAPHYFRVVKQRELEGRRRGGGVLTEEDRRAIHKGHPASPLTTFTRGCLAGTEICFVSHKGEVFPCGYLPLSAGNIRTTPFTDIWQHSPLWEGFRNTDLLQGKCGACEFKNICLGCRARAYHATGNYLAEEPHCVYEPLNLRERDTRKRGLA